MKKVLFFLTFCILLAGCHKEVAPEITEEDLAYQAYQMLGLMLKDALAFYEEHGTAPLEMSDFKGDYTLEGFRPDVNYNGPSLFRVKNGVDVYRIHFVAPYTLQYYRYPLSRKLCFSDYREYFIEVCGFLGKADVSDTDRHLFGYKIDLP